MLHLYQLATVAEIVHHSKNPIIAFLDPALARGTTQQAKSQNDMKNQGAGQHKRLSRETTQKIKLLDPGQNQLEIS